MKRKSIIMAVLPVLQLCSSLWALPTTAYEAEMVVTGWLEADSQPLDTVLGREVMRVETFNDDYGEPVYYIVYLHPSGFVIVSADDLVEPIIGFSDDGAYDLSPENPLGALVTNDLNGRIAAVRSTFGPLAMMVGKATVTETQEKWSYFIGLGEPPKDTFGLMGLPDKDIDDVRVAPLVKTKWDQDYIVCDTRPYFRAVYNYYTPQLVGGQVIWIEGDPDNYPCGCGATAMAQLMRYHEHPATGIGVHCSPIIVDGVDDTACSLGGDGNGGPYKWDLMVSDPNCDTTLEQRKAIGALCHDAGVAAKTEYRPYPPGSGTSTPKMMRALLNTFKYSNAILGYNEDSNIGTVQLNDMVNCNLDAGNPVVLAIRTPGNGHGVVCDGYGYNFSTRYQHLNMGASGLYDFWYNLPDIDYSLFSTYDSITECIYNIFTSGSGEIISGRVTDKSGNPVRGATVTAQGSGGPYTALTDSKGIYALVGVDSNSTYTVTVTKPGYEFEPDEVDTGTSRDYLSASGNRWGIDCVGEYDPNSNRDGCPLDAPVLHAEPNVPGGICDTISWNDVGQIHQYDSHVPEDIPDPGTVTSTLVISDFGTIEDLNVKVDISHSCVSDLNVFLIPPDGNQVELFTNVGGWGVDFNDTVLDDEASLSITEGSTPFTGSYRPEESLDDQIGKDIHGAWTLEVTDDLWLFSGTLNSWSLIVDLTDVAYYAECATDTDFGSVDANSGWIIDKTYTFTGLDWNQEYWYRVKARPLETWSQTRQADFKTGTLTDTRATSSGDVVLAGGGGIGLQVHVIEEPSYELGTGWTKHHTSPAPDCITVSRDDDWASEGTYSFDVYFTAFCPRDFKVGDYGSFRQQVDWTGIDTLVFDYHTTSAVGDLKLRVLIGNDDINEVWEPDDEEHFNAEVDVSHVTGVRTLELKAEAARPGVIYAQARFDHLRTYGPSSHVLSGSIISPPITLDDGDTWDIVVFNATTPEGATLTVDILPATGLDPIPGYANILSGTVLSDISERNIRLQANLSSSDPNVTPALHDWSVTYTKAFCESDWSNVESSLQSQ